MKRKTIEIPEFIVEAKERIGNSISDSKASDRDVIARYTAAIAGNFTDWIGKTIPWVRHELSRKVLIDNLRCEIEEDHVGMLLNFARLSGAMPDRADYAHTEEEVKKVRNLFRPVVDAGFTGLALCAVLESASEIFIPDLAERAQRLGCKLLEYTRVHGVADIAHSYDAIEALESEATMGYSGTKTSKMKAEGAVITLFARIYE